jgi:hypothetical protein
MDTTYYVLVCQPCGDLKGKITPIPFLSAKSRERWANTHTKGTGHDRWWTKDQMVTAAEPRDIVETIVAWKAEATSSRGI